MHGHLPSLPLPHPLYLSSPTVTPPPTYPNGGHWWTPSGGIRGFPADGGAVPADGGAPGGHHRQHLADTTGHSGNIRRHPATTGNIRRHPATTDNIRQHIRRRPPDIRRRTSAGIYNYFYYQTNVKHTPCNRWDGGDMGHACIRRRILRSLTLCLTLASLSLRLGVPPATGHRLAPRPCVTRRSMAPLRRRRSMAAFRQHPCGMARMSTI